ncbi:MAG: hypothetical protein RR356_06320 [Bacteroidales bacterium]
MDFDNGIYIKFEELDKIILYKKKIPTEEKSKYFLKHLDVKIEINKSLLGSYWKINIHKTMVTKNVTLHSYDEYPYLTDRLGMQMQ